MELTATTPAEQAGFLATFREVLRDELAPYQGRVALVARMVIASTVVMILNMTFKIPYGAFGAIFALLISREDSDATISDVETIIISFALSGAYIVIGAIFFAGDPMLRLLWVVTTLFVLFFALSVTNNFTAANRFGYLVVIVLPVWDEYSSAEPKVELTLWAIGAIALASLVTAAVELIFSELQKEDNILRGIDERLTAVEQVVRCWAAGGTLEERDANHLTRLSLVGAGKLQRWLQRSPYSLGYSEQMGAVVTLTGRLVDIAANLASLTAKPSPGERQLIETLADNIAAIRGDLLQGKIPRKLKVCDGAAVSRSVPLLLEMERTVSIIPEVFTGSQSFADYAPPPIQESATGLFRPDAFSNPQHFRFALKGCLAGSLCYITYLALDWPGISTSVTTCLLTGLSTVGSAHQKQFLRFTGAIAGGLVGIVCQMYILPGIDSITGFTVLFVVVTAVGAWIATSGPRLSYLGLQFAIAFNLLNVQDFQFQPDLVVIRDRVVGILLGLVMMWLVFDRLWGASAAVEMKRALTSVLHSLAQLARQPLSDDRRMAFGQSYSTRETINRGVNQVRAMADGVLYEFGPSREQDLAMRSRIVDLLPQLRLLLLTRVALLKYRLNLPGFELPEKINLAQREFDQRLAGVLDEMAARLEGAAPPNTGPFEESFVRLEQAVATPDPPDIRGAPGSNSQAFLTLSRRINSLALSLSGEIQTLH